MFKKKVVTILLTLMLLFSGCDLFQRTTTPNEHLVHDINTATKQVQKVATEIDQSIIVIDDNIVGIKENTIVASGQVKGTPVAPLIEDINVHADKISAESRKLRTSSTVLAKASAKLELSERTVDGYVQKINEVEKKNTKLTNKNTKLEENMKSGLNRMLKWIVGACVIGAGACAAMALFFGNIKGGLFGASTCIIIMVLAIAVGQYMMYIAIAGGILIVGTLGVLGYQLLIQRRAISDNVWTQEIAKQHMSTEVREKIYGGENEVGQAGAIQSPTTQKIVKNIKNRMPNAWKIFKD